MSVRWTKTAIGHLDSIFEYISQDSRAYALRMVDRITSRSTQIGDFPQSGRKVPEYESDTIREVLEGQFRIIYLVQPDRIDILAVVHAARDLRSVEVSPMDRSK